MNDKSYFIKLGAYSLNEKIDETRQSIVYRGKKENENSSYIIKILKTNNPSASEIARFKQEYDLIKSINVEGVVKVFEYIETENRLAIVLEDFMSIPLSKYLIENKVDLKTKIKIAKLLSDILGKLHLKNIIHKDIKPKNILINADKEEVKITDFGISTEVTHINDEIYNSEIIEGTLAYVSPEQTGRMNRAIDYRTDLYSLGITLYEMFIGERPFRYDDPMELIHAHIAIKPKIPSELIDSIPQVLSNIIMKLLAKSSEERYQNSFGISHDLQQCLDQLNEDGEINDFPIASEDISIRFHIPQILVGRDDEISILMKKFQRVTSGANEILMVSGYPGIGKSVLVNEIHKPVVANKGFFIKGKYEKLRRDVPYSAIIQAFMGLVNQVLIQSNEMIEEWKGKLLEVLGTSGKVITDLVPGLELIIGEQPDVPELGPVETINRFNHLFRSLIGVFADNDHPLVLFLDDLQWADLASCQLIEQLMTDYEIASLFLIGSYRNNELENSPYLQELLNSIEKQNIHVESINLGPLKVEDINELVSTFLRCPMESSESLAQLLHKKTNGNPFFVNQFLKTIYNEGKLRIEPGSGWKWDIREIEKMQVSDNVVELLANKISDLPEDTREMLKIGSCIGNRFDLHTLSIIINKSIDETLACLNDAIKEEYIILSGDMYFFHHDRIQEAAYSLIPENEKASLHYEIATYLLESTPEDKLFSKVVYITDQFNSAKKYPISDDKKIVIAGLNLQTAEKAKSSGAYDSSLRYSKSGIEFLKSLSLENSGKDKSNNKVWKKHYDIMYPLHLEGVEACCLLRDYEQMYQFAEEALKFTNNALDKGKIYKIFTLSSSAQGKHNEAVKTGLKTLKILGVNLPGRPGKLRALWAIIKIKILLMKTRDTSLINLPLIQDPNYRLILSVFMNIAPSTYLTRPNLFPLYAYETITTSLKYGCDSITAYAVITYGFLMCSFGYIEEGYKYGKLAIELLKNRGSKDWGPANYFVFTNYVQHWKEHLKNTVPQLVYSYNLGLETGDLEFASMSIMCHSYQLVFTCENLEEASKEIEKYIKEVKKIKHDIALNQMKMVHQFVYNFLHKTSDPTSLMGPSYDETNDTYVHAVCLYKSILCYDFGNYEEGLKQTNIARRRLRFFQGLSYVQIFYFYDSLIRIAVSEKSSRKKRKQYLKQVKKNQKKLKKYSIHAPMNCMHKYYLVEAELARVQGNLQAIEFYEKSIQLAKKNEYFKEEALAIELTSIYYLRKKMYKQAKFNMQEALGKYASWGAKGKVDYLNQKYQELSMESTGNINFNFDDTESTYTSSSLSTSGTTNLDISTIIKSSQALSSEIELDKLLEKVMKLAIENAGAQKGYLLMKNQNDNKLYIEATGLIDEIKTLQSIPLDSFDDIPTSIINYVHKTGENVVLSDALVDARFNSDPYIIKNKNKSIVCAPIRYKGVSSGIIYVENNLTTDAFTFDRLEVMKIFSSQVAISIENTRLLAEREDAAKIQTEMQIAADIQTSLVPEKPHIDGFEITSFMKPADDVGGDYYDIINFENHDWIVIGDVSGHGVPAGLVMIMTQSTIHTILNDNPQIQPSKLLAKTNRTIVNNINLMGQDKYMTITVCTVDKNGKIIFSGLHQDLLIYRKKTCRVEKVESRGMWIGFLDKIEDTLTNDEITLEKGDVLFLYTDGITEAWEKGSIKDKRGVDQMFGEEGVVKILEEYGQDSTEDIKNALLKKHESYVTDDDVTFVILKKI